MSIKSYKGMDMDMKCRGFQYEPGGTYEADHAVRCGGPGFHACEIPLDVFYYYPPAESRFFEVEQDGELSRDNEDSKVASSILKVGAEIGIPGLIKAHVEWVKEQIREEKMESNTGNRSAATNTGDFSAATNTGNRSAATNTGNRSAAEVSGKDSVAAVFGFGSRARGALGCAIVVAERGDWNGETHPLIGIKAVIVDGETIKPDTWYTLQGGEFVEVE